MKLLAKLLSVTSFQALTAVLTLLYGITSENCELSMTVKFTGSFSSFYKTTKYSTK
jgi:hypothetical protein